MASPPLTAVRQPFEELGQIATRLLVDMAGGKPPVVDRFELATALTLRVHHCPHDGMSL
jgi:DNA-binding LacI/PurR family transcriptional regulator